MFLGDIYDGQFNMNVFEGDGVYIVGDTSKYYLNILSHTKLVWFNVLYCIVVDRYTGEFKRGDYHGKGKLEYGNGDVYEGMFYCVL